MLVTSQVHRGEQILQPLNLGNEMKTHIVASDWRVSRKIILARVEMHEMRMMWMGMQCLCAHTHTHTYIHAYIHTYMHIYTLNLDNIQSDSMVGLV